MVLRMNYFLVELWWGSFYASYLYYKLCCILWICCIVVVVSKLVADLTKLCHQRISSSEFITWLIAWDFNTSWLNLLNLSCILNCIDDHALHLLSWRVYSSGQTTMIVLKSPIGIKTPEHIGGNSKLTEGFRLLHLLIRAQLPICQLENQ